MFYSNKVDDTRRYFFIGWQKYIQKQPLTPLEQQLVEVIIEHPEYHSFLEAKSPCFSELKENNPFLHMGLHLALREQIATNRPEGILKIYQGLLKKYQEPQVVEHLMMECLAQCLWEAQKDKKMPDEQQYLRLLNQWDTNAR